MKFEERLEFVLDQKRQVHNQSGDESKTYPCDIENKLNHTHTHTYTGESNLQDLLIHRLDLNHFQYGITIISKV